MVEIQFLHSQAVGATKFTGKKDKAWRVISDLQSKYTPNEPLYRDLAKYFAPERMRLFGDEEVISRDHIIDTNNINALNVATSGIMSGASPASRNWLSLSVNDYDVAQMPEVREYLSDASKRIYATFSDAKLYRFLEQIYRDLLIFGTAVGVQEEDFDTISRFHALPMGTYYIGADGRGDIVYLGRKFKLTAYQIVDTYAKKDKNGKIVSTSNISEIVLQSYRLGNLATKFDVYQLIQPSKEGRYKFESLHFELGSKGFLKESGYMNNPIIYARWTITGHDAWASNCPGISTLGGVRAIQVTDKEILASSSLKNRPIILADNSLKVKLKNGNIGPGSVVFSNMRANDTKATELMRSTLDTAPLTLYQQKHIDLVNEQFYKDLFLAVSKYLGDGKERTAYEIDQITRERTINLGTMLHALETELLAPLVKNHYKYMSKQGYLPEAPEAMRSSDIKVDFVSVMARAQRSAETALIEKFLTMIQGISQTHPEVLQKINILEVVDTLASSVGMDPRFLKDNKEVEAAIQAAKQQAMQRESESAEAAAFKDAAAGMKSLSQSERVGPEGFDVAGLEGTAGYDPISQEGDIADVLAAQGQSF